MKMFKIKHIIQIFNMVFNFQQNLNIKGSLPIINVFSADPILGSLFTPKF
jgi:hypothetical protein